MMKFQGLLSACSLEVIQLRFLMNLTTPSLLVTPLTHPSSLISICRISAMISLSQRSMREDQLFINLCSLLTIVQTSKMSLQMPEPVHEEGYARCQELWQSQCHSKISLEGTRCTTWRHKPCVSMNTIACMTAISTFKIACIILLRFFAEVMGDIMYLQQSL